MFTANRTWPRARKSIEQPGRFDGDRDLGLFGRGTQVRRDDNLTEADERMILRRRLGIEDVDGGAGDLTGLQGFRECGLVDQAARGHS